MKLDNNTIQVENHPVDLENIRLLHDVFFYGIAGHLYRGFTIVGGKSRTLPIIREIQEYSGIKKTGLVCVLWHGISMVWNG